MAIPQKKAGLPLPSTDITHLTKQTISIRNIEKPQIHRIVADIDSCIVLTTKREQWKNWAFDSYSHPYLYSKHYKLKQKG